MRAANAENRKASQNSVAWAARLVCNRSTGRWLLCRSLMTPTYMDRPFTSASVKMVTDIKICTGFITRISVYTSGLQASSPLQSTYRHHLDLGVLLNATMLKIYEHRVTSRASSQHIPERSVACLHGCGDPLPLQLIYGKKHLSRTVCDDEGIACTCHPPVGVLSLSAPSHDSAASACSQECMPQ